MSEILTQAPAPVTVKHTARIEADVEAFLQQSCRRLRYRNLAANLVTTLLTAIAVWLVMRLLFSDSLAVLISLFFAVVFYVYRLQTSGLRDISPLSLLEHINRRLPDYEESAQLLLQAGDNLSLLQQLQRRRIKKIFDKDLKHGALLEILPGWPWQGQLRLVFLLAIVALFSWNWPQLKALFPINSGEEISQSGQPKPSQPMLDSVTAQITPPAYTGLPPSTESDLNLQVLEGSRVNFQFQFIGEQENYYVLFNGEAARPLRVRGAGFGLEIIAQNTRLFQLAYGSPDKLELLPGVHTIAVVKDQFPKIRLIKPEASLVEIRQGEEPAIEIQALVSDDFAISGASILASVAKGSGEAVKFRDETFEFASKQTTEKGVLYRQSWFLPELGMEPGDEVYFNVIATDNKMPDNQKSKSSSVIVRWLEESEETLAVEGMRINFIPEYFRSQRQIIIETEALIADQKALAVDEFEAKSIDLGQSQSDLKQKYGQYLGDEFGEGEGAHFGLADGYHGGEDVAMGEATAGLEESQHEEDQHDENQHDEHERSEHQAAIGHDHEESQQSGDLSGASELIAQFAHNHGSAEVGPMSRRDPKTWMKKAVSVMWQAELHLMLSQPAQALPYEYEAYEYLKLARQADRIYVQRLGFEPPPVKESARLTGELDDIQSQSKTLSDSPDTTQDAWLFRQAFDLLARATPGDSLTSEQIAIMNQLGQRLLGLAETRPALLKSAALVTQMVSDGRLVSSRCPDCASKLANRLWSLLPEPTSMPANRETNGLLPPTLESEYQQAVSRLKLSQGQEG